MPLVPKNPDKALNFKQWMRMDPVATQPRRWWQKRVQRSHAFFVVQKWQRRSAQHGPFITCVTWRVLNECAVGRGASSVERVEWHDEACGGILQTTNTGCIIQASTITPAPTRTGYWLSLAFIARHWQRRAFRKHVGKEGTGSDWPVIVTSVLSRRSHAAHLQ